MVPNFHKLIEIASNADLYKGTQILRWSSRSSIKTENDCEHQNIVTQLTMMICHLYNIDTISTYTTRNAIGLAAIHDMFEYASGGMGDIPHSVKLKSPEIKKIVEDHEKETILAIPIFGELWKEYTKDELAVKIVDLADSLDVILFIKREQNLGNQDNDFKIIEEKTYPRIAQNVKELLELLDDKN